MQPALAWLLIGLMLVVIELMTGTFYLLILGVAAGIGSLSRSSISRSGCRP